MHIHCHDNFDKIGNYTVVHYCPLRHHAKNPKCQTFELSRLLILDFRSPKEGQLFLFSILIGIMTKNVILV